MRQIALTVHIDGSPTKIKVAKVARQRRFQISIGKEVTEYVISDETNEIEYYEGIALSEQVEKEVIKVILQYYPNTRAIEKIGEDDYSDYDDF